MNIFLYLGLPCLISSGLTFYFCNWEFSDYIKNLKKIHKQNIKDCNRSTDYYKRLYTEKIEMIHKITTIIQNKDSSAGKKVDEIKSILRVVTYEDFEKSEELTDEQLKNIKRLIDSNRVRIMPGMYPNGVFGCG